MYTMSDKNDRGRTYIAERPETMIERIFLEKTNVRNDGTNIRKQWFVDKKYYVNQTKLTVLDFEHYSMHDESHSRNILNALGYLLGEDMVQMLSVGDLWLILQSAYFHDAGMVLTNQYVRKLWKENEEFQKYLEECLTCRDEDLRRSTHYLSKLNDKLLNNGGALYDIDIDSTWPIEVKHIAQIITADYARRNHGDMERLCDKIAKDSDIEYRLYRTMAQVCHMHTEDFKSVLSELKYEEICFGDSILHPQFVSALLRMGDLLDLDNNRFDTQVLRHYGQLPESSLVHLEKHKSLSHFRITPTMIEAESDTSRVEVAIEAYKWFEWIRQENHNLIAYWNKIAPDVLGGCRLSECDLKVRLSGEEFSNSGEVNYEINKKYAIQLLIGENIYESSLDFLREYIQNAVDASKLAFYNEWMDGDLDYLRDQSNRNRRSELPCYFYEAAYKKYGVKIELSIINNNNLMVKICDNGVGIEEEAIDALTTIGSGWRERKEYWKQIEESIWWLQPTGGFGIGIQAAFMITDKVVFETKSAKDSKGICLTLKDPRKMGGIVKQRKKGLRNGTCVKIEIPLMKLMNRSIYNKNTNFNSSISFDDEFIMDEVVNGIRVFIEGQIRNSVFPVTLLSDIGNRRQYEIFSPYWYERKIDKGRLNTNKKRGYQFKSFNKIKEHDEEIYYSINETFDQVTVVRSYEEDKLMTVLDFGVKKGKITYSFKGVSIVNEVEDGEALFSCYIDILEGDVKKYLAINRRSFNKQIDKKRITEVVINRTLIILLKEIDRIVQLNKLNKEKEELPLNPLIWHQMVEAMFYYLKKEELMEYKKRLIDVMDNEYECYVTKEQVPTYKIQLGDVSAEESKLIMQGFFEVCYNAFIGESCLAVETKEKAQYEITQDQQVVVLDKETTMSISCLVKIVDVIRKSICYIPMKAEDQINYINRIFRENYVVVKIGEVNLRLYMQNSNLESKVRKSCDVDFRQILGDGNAYVLEDCTKYPALQVSKIPFEQENRLEANLKRMIVWVPYVLYGVVKKEARFDNTPSTFLDEVKKTDHYRKDEIDRYIRWIYEHQYEVKYKISDIEKEYDTFLKDFYEYTQLKAQE